MNGAILLQSALIVAGAFVLYAVFSRGLFLAAARSRQRAIELADELQHCSDVPEFDKQVIIYTLDDFHSASRAWKIAYSTTVFVATLPFRDREVMEQVVANDTASRMSKDTAAKFNNYRMHWIHATLANSLAASLIYRLMTLLAMALSVSSDAIEASVGARKGHGNGHAHG
jgi:hypothetical protein